MKKSELLGKRFGKLVAIKEVEKRASDGRVLWICKCDCGKESTVRSTHLVRGKIKSCGCEQGNGNLKHGMWKTRIYKVWSSVKSRCMSENNSRYYDYGGRGITICDEWLDFENFYKDMGDSPTKKHQIDRIDNNKGYSKENCRWVTPSQNMANRNKSKKSLNKYKGVHQTKNKKWTASITKNYKTYRLGTFETEEQAAKAYDLKSIELNGEYANLNFK